MRVRFTDSVAGVYIGFHRGQEVEVGDQAGQLTAAQAAAWLESGQVVRVPDAPEAAVLQPGERAVARGRAEARTR